MKSQEQLINNIIGQLNGIRSMIEAEQDCQAVVIQMKAARSAFNSLIRKYLETNLSHCLKSARPQDKKRMEIIFRELIK